jgi:hypothetical protein
MKATLIIPFVALCIVSVAAQEATPSVETSTACGSPTVNFDVKLSASQPIPQPEEGKALIYVVEDQKFSFVNDVTIRVGLNGSWIGATRGNSYLSFAVEPGEHHLCVDWVSDWLPSGRLISLYGLTAEAGKVYYLRARTMGSARDRMAVLDFDLINIDQAKFLIASSSVSVSHPKK